MARSFLLLIVLSFLLAGLTGCGLDDGPRDPDAAFSSGPSVSTSTDSSPSSVYEGESFTVSFGVTNLGEKASAFAWRIVRNGITVGSGTTQRLGNQDTTQVSQAIVENVPGVYTYAVELDPDHQVDESQNNDWGGSEHQYGEFNNNASFVFTVLSLGSG